MELLSFFLFQVRNTDEKLDNLGVKVENIEKEMFKEDADIEVFKLLQSVTEVKNDYQNLRKEIMEVQELQKQLTCSLRQQLKLVQGRFNYLKDKITLTQPTPPQTPVQD